ncbi:MAG: hypothetical protein ACI4HN_08690, partial [Ruminococcus sp.]
GIQSKGFRAFNNLHFNIGSRSVYGIAVKKYLPVELISCKIAKHYKIFVDNANVFCYNKI